MDKDVAAILAGVGRVTIQLSNLCNFAEQHPRCPVRTFTEKQILDTGIIEEVICTLAAVGFDSRRKKIAWHVYNDPLIDPRLVDLCKFVRKRLPTVEIHLWSNGWYLNYELAETLIAAGVTRFTLTAYSTSEASRFADIADQLKGAAKIEIAYGKLLSRVMATEEIVREKYSICHAPFQDLVIRASGKIGLCCLDWAEQVTFGNLYTQEFAAVLEDAYPRMAALQAELLAGKREMPVCRQCQWKR